MTENATVKIVEHLDPSPVPEANWFWRRVYTYLVTLVLVIHIGFTTWYRTSDVQTLREVIRNDQILLGMVLLLYLAGASAEAIAKIFAAVRTSRKETTTTAPPPSTITTTTPASETKVETPPPAQGWER